MEIGSSSSSMVQGCPYFPFGSVRLFSHIRHGNDNLLNFSKASKDKSPEVCILFLYTDVVGLRHRAQNIDNMVCLSPARDSMDY